MSGDNCDEDDEVEEWYEYLERPTKGGSIWNNRVVVADEDRSTWKIL
jgi:hypothetical protein